MPPFKTTRVTKNLGVNTARTQDESYNVIAAKSPTASCTSSLHEGERTLPVRSFYLNGGGTKLQGACIKCQTTYRRNRIDRSREKFKNLTPAQVRTAYITAYGPTKRCSNCDTCQTPDNFTLSPSMECGLHNHCITCSIGNSQGSGGLREFIFMPDKDGIKYTKKSVCERCGGTDTLAVDHIIPIAKGGTDCINNKQTLCRPCNSKKSDTIDCIGNINQLCERYRGLTLDFTNFIQTSQRLAQAVAEFVHTNITSAPLSAIDTSIAEYKKKYNLGHDLIRISAKLAERFNKL